MPIELSPHPRPLAVVFSTLALFFFGSLLGSLVVEGLSAAQGLDLRAGLESFGAESSTAERNFVKGLLLINHIFSFLMPSVLIAWMVYRRRWVEVLNLDKTISWQTSLLLIPLLACAFVLAQGFFELNSFLLRQTPWFDSLTEAEKLMERLQVGLLKMDSVWDLLSALLVMAIVPAIGEELLFRGLIQKHLTLHMGRAGMAIVITALLFSVVHFQAQRFFAIFWLGMVLGWLYFKTANLWVPIAAHFLNNAMQVFFAWANQAQLEKLNQESDVHLEWWTYLLATVLLIGFAYLLKILHSEQPRA